MEIIDISKAVRRKSDRRRHEIRRSEADENTILARIAKLQRVLDTRVRKGDREGFLAGRRELCDLIFTVVSEDMPERKRN